MGNPTPSTYWSGKSLERRTAMKKLLVVAILAAAALTACGRGSTQTGVSPAASAGDPKQTRIHFTKNYEKGIGPNGQKYDTDCVGIVTTERIYGPKGQKIKWKISKN